jgi:hypothetical protein
LILQGALHPPRHRLLVALILTKVITASILLALGFSHVSDDDFARIVIAQTFAARPALDPSGTSWLPFPFWVAGTVFMAVGRSLAVAKVLAVAQSALAWCVLLRATERDHLRTWPAWLACMVAMCLPWNVWLGATLVPEGFVGPLLAAAMMLGATPNGLAAALLVVCTLSRYESWPVALALASLWLVRGVRARNLRWACLALLALFGPLAWAAWNLHAHGDALHFFARVSRYRQSLHLAPLALAERVAVYPSAALAVMGPLAWIGLGAVPALFLSRKLWQVPLALALVQLGALIAGELTDGAPTHHPERAVLAIVTVVVTAGVSGWITLLTTIGKGKGVRERFFALAAAALAIYGGAWIVREVPQFPGQSESDARQAQLSRGRGLVPTERYRVTPCSYEHFALIAAFGRPEQVEIMPPSVRTPPTADCPKVAPLSVGE